MTMTNPRTTVRAAARILVAGLLLTLAARLAAQSEDLDLSDAEIHGEFPPWNYKLSPWDGFVVQDSDGDPRFHVGGVFVLDYLQLDSRNERDGGLRLDRALLRAEGTFLDFSWRFVPDLKGIDTRGLDEAWLAWEPESLSRKVRVSTGLMEIPLGIEHSIPEEDLSFAGYSFPAFLDSRTDWGLRVDGEFEEGLFSYDLAATVGDGFNRLGDRVSGPRMSARAVVYPFRWWDYSVSLFDVYEFPLLSGLFASIAYSHTESFEGNLEVANPFRNELFIADRLDADQSDFFYFGYGLDLGPFLLFHEIVRGGYRGLETPAGGEDNLDDQVTAWSAALAWMVTGEPYDSRPFRRRESQRHPTLEPRSAAAEDRFPREPLWRRHKDEGETGIGALELAVRYSNSDIDREFFNLGFTDFTTSSQEFRTLSVAVNWYPVSNLRVTTQVVRTIADQFPATFDSHGRDTSFVFRLQYAF